MTGSRMALLGSVKEILARMHHLSPASPPVAISAKCASESAGLMSRRAEAIPSHRSFLIYRSSLVSSSSSERSEGGTDGLLVRVVGVGVALLNHADAELVQLIEVVGRVGDLLALDAEHGKILDDGLLELGLLLRRVRVVETDEELALVDLGEVLVENRGL